MADTPNYTYIDTTDALTAACNALRSSPFLAVDTEFLRDKTYFAKLCLLQIATPDNVYLIDPLAENIILDALWEVLLSGTQELVFHAARQDLEIVFQTTGELPGNVFDTQIAAAALGYGESLAYDKLALKLLDTTLHKGERFTDWSQRPLHPDQLSYAADDVIYLAELYPILKRTLESKDRLHWMKEEVAYLLDPALHTNHPDDAWKRVKAGKIHKPAQLAALQALARWRESEAIRRNIPRGRIVKDDILVAIATTLPRDTKGLKRIRNTERLPGHIQEKLIALLEEALSAPKASFPAPKPSSGIIPDNAIADMLSALLKSCAAEHNLSSRLIATRDDLNTFLTNKEACRFLSGWRYELFGAKAEALMAGKLYLGITNGTVDIRSL